MAATSAARSRRSGLPTWGAGSRKPGGPGGFGRRGPPFLGFPAGIRLAVTDRELLAAGRRPGASPGCRKADGVPDRPTAGLPVAGLPTAGLRAAGIGLRAVGIAFRAVGIAFRAAGTAFRATGTVLRGTGWVVRPAGAALRAAGVAFRGTGWAFRGTGWV